MFKRRRTNNNTAPLALGIGIEQQACQWLTRRGLHTVERNYRCRQGEIDIIMLDRQQLVFIEVRYRRQSHFGGPADTVNWRKQQKLLKAARHYLAHRPEHRQRDCRFDVLAAQPADKQGAIDWQWIQNAFTA